MHFIKSFSFGKWATQSQVNTSAVIPVGFKALY